MANTRRLIIDGPIGVGKSTLLRRYANTFLPQLVTGGPFGSRVVRQPEQPPVLLLPEPAQRWEEKCAKFYTAKLDGGGENDSHDRLVELQLGVLEALLERQVLMLKFWLDNPGGVVVQERGFASMKIFLRANQTLFTQEEYVLLSEQADFLQQTEEGSLRCLLSLPEGKEGQLIEWVQDRGDVIPSSYLRDIAKLYREAAGDFDMVWNPLAEDVKKNLASLVESLV